MADVIPNNLKDPFEKLLKLTNARHILDRQSEAFKASNNEAGLKTVAEQAALLKPEFDMVQTAFTAIAKDLDATTRATVEYEFHKQLEVMDPIYKLQKEREMLDPSLVSKDKGLGDKAKDTLDKGRNMVTSAFATGRKWVDDNAKNNPKVAIAAGSAVGLGAIFALFKGREKDEEGKAKGSTFGFVVAKLAEAAVAAVGIYAAVQGAKGTNYWQNRVKNQREQGGPSQGPTPAA